MLFFFFVFFFIYLGESRRRSEKLKVPKLLTSSHKLLTAVSRSAVNAPNVDQISWPILGLPKLQHIFGVRRTRS